MEREKLATILIEAHERGHNAAMNADVQMIRSQEYDGRLSDEFPICGVAGLNVDGVRGKALAEFKRRGFKKVSDGRQYLTLRVGDYDQSYDMKRSYAVEYARTLKENGFYAYAWHSIY